jgi:hypothetical protein
MPMPVIAPTETCVVDTGKPRRLAKITIRRNEIGGERLAIIHFRDLLAHGFGHFSGIKPTSYCHSDGYDQRVELDIEGPYHKKQTDDFGRVIQPARETYRGGARHRLPFGR